jgi:EmrB/QacA subfamily drug resistance transporter
MTTHDARTKRLTLLACILGSAIVFLDGTVVNVALPALQEDLGAGLSGQQWVVESYMLTLSSLLLVGGSLDDMFDRRTIFGVGVAAFGVTSLLCAVAPNVETLIAFRALQGAAGALLVPSTLALIIATFPPDERGMAIGTWTAWTGTATVIGPLAGGFLIDTASWRWIFAINVIPVAITLWLVLRAVPVATKRPAGGRVDFLGGALCALGLGGTIFALIEQPVRGWDDPAVAFSLVGGLIALVVFVLHEARTPEPMLELGLFRSRNFAVGNAATLAMYAGLGGMFFVLGLFVQQIGGYSALEAGAAFLPVTALVFVLAKRFGALADRHGPRLFMGLGPIVAGIGILMMLRLDEDASYFGVLLPALAVFGLGLAIVVAPLTAAVLASVDDDHSGVASGVNNAVSRVAGLLAIAALGTILSSQFAASIDEDLAGQRLTPAAQAAVENAKDRPLARADASGAPPAQRAAVEAASVQASVDALHTGLLASAIVSILGGIIAGIGIVNPKRLDAEHCPGGAICGAPESVATVELPEREPAGAPV